MQNSIQRISWCAVYNDGSKLYQYNGDKINKYEDIQRDKLVAFVLLKDNAPLILFHLDKDQRLIYRKRHFQKFMTGQHTYVYLAGWQKKVKGENVQSIACVFPNGQIQMIGKWQDNILFREPELRDFEKD